MTWEHAAVAAVAGIVVGLWLARIVVGRRRRQAAKPPPATPWADSTKVAQELRAQRRGRRTALLTETIADEDRHDSD